MMPLRHGCRGGCISFIVLLGRYPKARFQLELSGNEGCAATAVYVGHRLHLQCHYGVKSKTIPDVVALALDPYWHYNPQYPKYLKPEVLGFQNPVIWGPVQPKAP